VKTGWEILPNYFEEVLPKQIKLRATEDIIIMPGDTRTIITEAENTPREKAHIVPNENWLIRNRLLCSRGQNEECTKLELKNVGPVPRIVY